jgi:ABC-type polysaccharide/polyol phosphate export permease
MEYCRLGVITLLLWALGGIALPESGVHFLRIFFWLLLLWIMGLMLGFLRACIIILDRGYTELMDHAFLLFIFTSCTYIPLTILPGPLRIVTLLNPLYHFLQIGRASWSSAHIVNAQWLWGSLCPLLFGVIVLLFWRASRTEVLDKSFS